jgi:hypothetical protein
MTILTLTYNLPIAFGVEIKFPIFETDKPKVEDDLKQLFCKFMRQPKILPLKNYGVKVNIGQDKLIFWKRKHYYFSSSIDPIFVIKSSGVLVLQNFANHNDVSFYPYDHHFNNLYDSTSSFSKMWKILNRIDSENKTFEHNNLF